MSRNATARRAVQENPFMQIAKKVEVREIEEATAEVINEEAEEPTKPTEQPTAQEQPTPQVQNPEVKVLSIDEIKRKNEVLSRLTAKYDLLTEKRRRVENFEISHDRDTASLTVEDANGEVFESNSPKTIAKLIEFWKEEFNTVLAEVEKEIRETA